MSPGMCIASNSSNKGVHESFGRPFEPSISIRVGLTIACILSSFSAVSWVAESLSRIIRLSRPTGGRRAHTFWALSAGWNITQLRMADETLDVILIVEKWNRSRMLATVKSQFKSFVSHIGPSFLYDTHRTSFVSLRRKIPRYILDTSSGITPGHSR